MSAGPLVTKLVRFERPERSHPYAWNLDDATRAAILGTDAEGYAAALADLERQRTDAVAALAARPVVQRALDRMPFAAGERLLAIGESTTADRLSWFEVLAALFAAERPELGVRFDNAAVSGATTTETLGRLLALRRHPADRVFCMLGANDARRFGADGPRLVSAEETTRNLRVLRTDAAFAGAAWTWVVPTAVDEAAVAAFPYFGGAGLAWTNRDVRETAAAIGGLAASGDLVVDPAEAPDGIALGDDGVHPDPAGQLALAELVLLRLAGADLPS